MKISCFVDGDKPLPRYTRYRVAHGVFDVSSAKSCKSVLISQQIARPSVSGVFLRHLASLLYTEVWHHLIWWSTSPWQETRHATSLRLGNMLSPPHGNISGGFQYYCFWKSVVLLSQYQPTETPVPVSWYWKGYCTSGNMELYVTASLWLFVELML